MDTLHNLSAAIVLDQERMGADSRSTGADWVIDMGPGAGHVGGTVVFAGTPADLAEHPTSLTGRHLRAHLASGISPGRASG